MKKILPFALVAGLISAPLAQAKMNSGGQTYANFSAGYGTADIGVDYSYVTLRDTFSLGARGYIASLSLGHFLDAASTTNKALGFEGVAERSNISGKVNTSLTDVSIWAKPSLRFTFGGLLVGKYSFSPSAAFMLKGGVVVSRWDFHTSTSGASRANGTQLTGFRAEIASEFKVNDEVHMNVAAGYTEYKRVRIKHPFPSRINQFIFSPKLLSVKLGVTRYFTI